MSLKNVPFGEIQAFNAIIEVPQGGKKKYEYDSKLGGIKLEGVLYGEIKYPYNYGHIPQTESGDGDNLDVVLFSTYPLMIGSIVPARPIGLMEVMDRGQEDHKIMAVPLSEHGMENIRDLADLPQEKIEEIKNFYKDVAGQWKRDVRIKGFFGAAAAKKELLRTQILD